MIASNGTKAIILYLIVYDKIYKGFTMSYLRFLKSLALVVSTVILGFVFFKNTYAQTPSSQLAIFHALKPGQRVALNSLAGTWEIQLINDGSIGSYSIVELGHSHIQLMDFSGLRKIWIPASAIRSVLWTQVPGEFKPQQ
jgi:hypothetical protein